MISAAIQKELVDQQIIVETAYNDFYKALSDRDNFQASVDELNRQIQYHLSRGDNANANIVNGQLPQAQGYLTQAKIAYNAALALYKTELSDYVQIKNKLSPADRLIQDKADESNAALNGTGNVNQAPKNYTPPNDPTPTSTNYAQNNTKWYIGGGILFTLLIFAAIFFRKRKTQTT